MQFSEVVRARRMVRNYDPARPVPRPVLERMLGNAIHAPSAGFSQGWAFLVLSEPEQVARFWAAATPEGAGPTPQGAAPTPQDAAPPPQGAAQGSWLAGMQNAPVIIIPLSNRSAYLDRYAEQDKGWADRDEARWPVPYWHIDTGMAALLMLLTAVDEGLGACFFGIPPGRTDAFRAEFAVPVEYTPIGAITVGYRAPDRRSPSLRRGRRAIDQVTHWGSWRVAPGG